MPYATASRVSPRLVVALADAREQEHLVVHGEAEQHREQEQRNPGLDGRHDVEAEQPGAVALLGHEHEQAVGGADGEQVHGDAGSGTTIERKATISRMKLRPSTSANTIGR